MESSALARPFPPPSLTSPSPCDPRRPSPIPLLRTPARSPPSIFLTTIAGLVLSPLPVGAWAFLGLTAAILTKTLTFSAAFGAFTNEVIWLIVISFFDRGLPKDPSSKKLGSFLVLSQFQFFTSIKGISAAQTEEAKAEAVSQVFAGLQLLEEAFKNISKGKGFFGGESVGYLDIALGCYLGWIKVTEKNTGIQFLDEEKTPLLAGWAERFCADAAVKEVMPEIEKLMEFAKVMRAKMQAAAPAK